MTDHSEDSANEVLLVERTRESDPEAFRTLFERYQPTLFRYVLYNIHEVDLAHDIVQETFVRVWNYRASLRPHLPFLALLFRISRNLLRDQFKRSAVRRAHEQDIPDHLHPTAEDPEQSLLAGLLEERIREMVRTELPEKCREVFVLSRMEEMTNAEVARRLGISVKTVENQITRALKILRRHMRGYLG